MIKFLVTFFCLTTCFCHAYENYQSIEEVIAKETQAIELIPDLAHEELATIFAARGESYILINQNEKAIEDFESALFHAEYSNNAQFKWVIAFSAIFGKMISYDQLSMEDQADYAIEQLKILVNYFDCEDEAQFALDEINSANEFFILPVEVDPNEPQPSWWCEQTVQNTMAVLKGIIVNIKRSAIQFAATKLIEKLEKAALNCCYRGGLWSGCLKPLGDKLNQWNQKWKVFGIPPDPSWDPDLR